LNRPASGVTVTAGGCTEEVSGTTLASSVDAPLSDTVVIVVEVVVVVPNCFINLARLADVKVSELSRGLSGRPDLVAAPR